MLIFTNLMKFISALILILLSVFVQAQSSSPKFDKVAFYTVMKIDDSLKINEQLTILTIYKIKEKDIYVGALLMKKAGMITNLKIKLKDFKAGRKKLEDVLVKDSANTEYHFLRLMIQENAPKILNYNTEIDKDNLYIRKNFKSLSKELQEIVMDYSKHSKALQNLNKQ